MGQRLMRPGELEEVGRTITLKYAGKCGQCGALLPVGSESIWYAHGQVYCVVCPVITTGEKVEPTEYRECEHCGEELSEDSINQGHCAECSMPMDDDEV